MWVYVGVCGCIREGLGVCGCIREGMGVLESASVCGLNRKVNRKLFRKVANEWKVDYLFDSGRQADRQAGRRKETSIEGRNGQASETNTRGAWTLIR
jgi:hypothetical protein